MTEAGVAERPGTPWLQRLCEGLALSPVRLAAALAVSLSLSFLASELALGRLQLFPELQAGAASPRDVRLAFVNILLLAYAPAAFLSVAQGTRRRVEALRPLFDPADGKAHALLAAVGSYAPRALRSAGLAGLAAALVLPFLVQGAESAYRPSRWSPEVAWHRALAPVAGWFTGRFLYAVVVESRRLSALALRLPHVDLFDLGPLALFARQGLANALLNVGFLSIFALSLFEADFRRIFALLGVANLAVCAAGLLLPALGAYLRIRAAKSAELEACREALRAARASSAPGASALPAGQLADLLAYRAFVENVREWPFDASTLARFGLYLLIPLGSWAGGALVERLINAILG